MSFRIVDILKKDPPPNNNSILQQTLLNNKPHPPYYHRSQSEPFLKINETSDSSPYHYHQHHLRSSFCDLYNDKEYWCMNLARNRLWATYYCTTPPYQQHPMIFHPNFSHYSKRKGGQVRFTPNQTDALEKRFVLHKYLSPEDRRVLADSLKLTDRQVKTWFQNRRAKWRRSNSTPSSSTNCDNFTINNSDLEEDNINKIRYASSN